MEQTFDTTAFYDEPSMPTFKQSTGLNGPTPVHEEKPRTEITKSLSELIAEQEAELAANKKRAIDANLDRIKALDIERAQLVAELKSYGYTSLAQQIFDSHVQNQAIAEGTPDAPRMRRGRPPAQKAASEQDAIDKRQLAREAKLAEAGKAARKKDSDTACKLCVAEHGEELAKGHSGRSHRWVKKFEKKAFTLAMLTKLKNGTKPKDLV